MTNNKQAFRDLLNKSKQLLQDVKTSLNIKTKNNFFARINTVEHLASLKKLHRELSAIKSIKQNIIYNNNNNISQKSIKTLNKALKKKPVKRTYFITATAKLRIEYITKQSKTRGNKIYYEDTPVAQSIMATSIEDAKQKFKLEIESQYTISGTGNSTPEFKKINVTDIEFIGINDFSDVEAFDEKNMFM